MPHDGVPKRGGTLRLPVKRDHLNEFVPTMQRQDPQVAWSYLDALVRIDPVEMTPKPGLATSWEWSADGLQLRFTLREDVNWHDGTLFTAKDAVFSHIAYRDDFRSVIAGQSALVTEVIAPDPATLVVQFAAPDGAWLFNVASMPVFQASQYLATWNANLAGERTLLDVEFSSMMPVGTGPWIVESISESGISFSRNDDYFDTPAHANHLELVALDEPSDRIEGWRSGKLDVVSQLPPLQVQDLLDEPGRLVVADAPRTVFAAFNFDNPSRYDPAMLADPAVREAISLALDRKRYAEDIWGGFLDEAQAGIVPQPWAFAPTSRNPSTSIIRAKLNLLNAGWSDITGDGILESPSGDEFVLTTQVLDSAAPEVIAMLEEVDTDLRQIGGALDLQIVPRDEFISTWTQDRAWDLIVYDLRLNPAFAEFDLVGSAWDIRNNPAGWNPGGYSNAVADDALAAYFESVDETEMANALATLQTAINDDLFALWFGFPNDLVLLAPYIKGFQPNPVWPTPDTRLLWIESDD